MGKGFNNYMTKKFFHPASKENIKRVWMAEQKTQFEKKKQEDLLAQYQKEQDMYRNRALLGDEKAKLGLSFMYDAPPGMKKKEEETQAEVKFDWQRKYNAPREQYAKDDDLIRDQPFGVEVRNVRCIKCRKWGHVNTDKICPLFGKDLTAEPEQPENSASSLLESMQDDGFTLKQSILGRMADPKAANEQILDSEDEDDPEVQFLKSLTPKQKKKLLKRLNKLQTKEKHKGDKKLKKKKKNKHRRRSSSDSDADEKKKKRRRSETDSSSSDSSDDEAVRKKMKSDSSRRKQRQRSDSEDSDSSPRKQEKHRDNKHLSMLHNISKDRKGTRKSDVHQDRRRHSSDEEQHHRRKGNEGHGKNRSRSSNDDQRSNPRHHSTNQRQRRSSSSSEDDRSPVQHRNSRMSGSYEKRTVTHNKISPQERNSFSNSNRSVEKFDREHDRDRERRDLSSSSQNRCRYSSSHQSSTRIKQERSSSPNVHRSRDRDRSRSRERRHRSRSRDRGHKSRYSYDSKRHGSSHGNRRRDSSDSD